jgi:hypothetical protein
LFGHRRAAVAAFMLVLSLLGPAASAPAATVTLRIEGSKSTIYEGSIRTTARAVDGGDGTGPHACQGTDPSAPSPTPTTALADAAARAGFSWHGTWTPDFDDFFIDSIGADASRAPDGYWSILADGWLTAGGCAETVHEAEDVIFAYGPADHVLELAGPTRVQPGEPFTVLVRDWRADGDGVRHDPMPGATVAGATSGADGEAQVTLARPGWEVLEATRPDAVRSNALLVCAEPCDAPPPPITTPTSMPPAPLPSLTPAAPAATPAGPGPGAAHARPGLRVAWPVPRTVRLGHLLQGFRLRVRIAATARLTAELWTADGDVRLGRTTATRRAGTALLTLRAARAHLPRRRPFSMTVRVTARTTTGASQGTRTTMRVLR